MDRTTEEQRTHVCRHLAVPARPNGSYRPRQFRSEQGESDPAGNVFAQADEGIVHVVPRLYDHMVESQGLCVEAFDAARKASKAVDRQPDLHAAREALTECQEGYNQLLEKFWRDVMSFDQIEDLVALARERGSQWSKWTTTYQSWITDSVECLLRVNKALTLCWQDMTDRLGISSVSVQATNIGQKIVAKASELKDMARDGVT